MLVRDWEADNDAPLWWRPFEARLARRELVGVFYAALRAMALFPRPVQWGTEWAETHDGPDEAFPSGDPLRTIQSDLVEQWLALRQGKQAGD